MRYPLALFLALTPFTVETDLPSCLLAPCAPETELLATFAPKTELLAPSAPETDLLAPSAPAKPICPLVFHVDIETD